MHLRHLPALPALLALLLVPAPAQSLVVLDVPSNAFIEGPAGSPAFPGGGPFGTPFPGSGTLMPTAPPFGGCALDNTTGIIYATDGFTITATNHPGYAALATPPAPFPKPAILTQPLTGLAIDPVGAPGDIRLGDRDPKRPDAVVRRRRDRECRHASLLVRLDGTGSATQIRCGSAFAHHNAPSRLLY